MARSREPARPADLSPPRRPSKPSPGPELAQSRANGRLARSRPIEGSGRAAVAAANGSAVSPRPKRPTPTLEIATAFAAAYKDALGSGPGKTTVHLAAPATLVVVHEQTMTAEERSLVALGEDKRLREGRLILTTALEGRFRSIVEGALGRRTLAFLSGLDTRRDVAVELFTLEPESAEGERP